MTISDSGVIPAALTSFRTARGKRWAPGMTPVGNSFVSRAVDQYDVSLRHPLGQFIGANLTDDFKGLGQRLVTGHERHC